MCCTLTSERKKHWPDFNSDDYNHTVCWFSLSEFTWLLLVFHLTHFKKKRERGIVSTIHRQQNKNGCDLSLNHGIVSATTVTLNMLQK